MADLNNLIQKAQLAIENWEDRDAKNILTKLRQAIVDQQIAQTRPDVYAKLQKWIVYLQLVAFPKLSDAECADILKNHYLESFAINVPMENRITGKLFFIPYLVRDELRETLKRGLMANGQNLGGQTIGQWIAEFEKQFNVHRRNESAPVDFVRENSQASTLPNTEKNILKEMLHTYDYLLVSNLPALGEDLENLFNTIPAQNNISTNVGAYPTGETAEQYFQAGQKRASYNPNAQAYGTQNETKNFVQIPLLQAFAKYPKLGEQIVSSNVLKLRIFPTPVRPSIKNWITDYHDYVGSGKHSAVDRGNYLFQSLNGKKLTPMERERISDMLKALDTEENVTVDPEKEALVFGAIQASVQSPPASKDNVYVSKVRNSNGPTFQPQPQPQPQRAAPTNGEQADVFDRYAGRQNAGGASQQKKPTFSPNFASGQTFMVNKKRDAQGSVEKFRSESSLANEDVALSSNNFHDFASRSQEVEPPSGGSTSKETLDGELSFSSSQKFSAEKQQSNTPVGPTQQPVQRQSWQRIKPFNDSDSREN